MNILKGWNYLLKYSKRKSLSKLITKNAFNSDLSKKLSQNKENFNTNTIWRSFYQDNKRCINLIMIGYFFEKIDKVSRNKKIIEKINKYFQDYKILSIADLGCGTGSNYRYLYPKLKKRQSWDKIDISFESIKEFKKKTDNKNYKYKL